MRHFNLIMLFLVSVCFMGCSDDDEEQNQLLNLKQTYWEGTLYRTSSNHTDKLKIVFYTDNEGACFYESGDGFDFRYNTESKLLNVNTTCLLSGYWILTKEENGHLILEQGMEYPWILNIKRIK